MTDQYQPKIGVCYYPEHWPESQWAEDAQSMVDAGITQVRIAEFAWSRIEPEPGRFDFAWLDRAIAVLADAGLLVTMCTPTATPPKWLVDQMPDMLAVDSNGQPRKFGSRRHYSFAHQGYRRESQRITKAVAERYGHHPAVSAWQTDNEYGCHDTILSWCEAAQTGFRGWLSQRYGTIDKLNTAWGNVFWSMEYRHFDEIDLPNQTVTEANPSHQLDFYRFSTDMVVQFNAEQVQILRELSPGRPIAHNYMGMFNQFNHYPVAADLDIASWDSYPIGMLQNMAQQAPQDSQQNSARQTTDCLRTGDPDFQAFHHDLYRGMGRLWVMEQQPGPVNWARTNAIPSAGAVRMWSFEAAAHGAELISYFRWRQAPFAQEQMHAGLLLRDSRPAPGLAEAKAFINDVQSLPWQAPKAAPIALIYDYEASWMAQLDGQSEDFHHLRLILDVYKAVRKNGGSVDVVSTEADLSGYKLIILPAVMYVSDDLAARLETSDAQILIGPRTGAKTQSFQLPETLAPGPLQALAGFCVEQVDALPASYPLSCSWNGQEGQVKIWHERGSVTGHSEGSTEDGHPLMVHGNKASYLTGWLNAELLEAVIGTQMQKAGLALHYMPDYLRVRQAGDLLIFTNYGPKPMPIPDSFTGALLLGDRMVPAAGVAVLRA